MPAFFLRSSAGFMLIFVCLDLDSPRLRIWSIKLKTFIMICDVPENMHVHILTSTHNSASSSPNTFSCDFCVLATLVSLLKYSCFRALGSAVNFSCVEPSFLLQFFAQILLSKGLFIAPHSAFPILLSFSIEFTTIWHSSYNVDYAGFWSNLYTEVSTLKKGWHIIDVQIFVELWIS